MHIITNLMLEIRSSQGNESFRAQSCVHKALISKFPTEKI